MADREAALARMRQVREAYCEGLPARLAAIEAVWAEAWRQDPPHAARLDEVHRLVHGLAGTAGTFGLAQVSAAALRLEERLVAAPEADRSAVDRAFEELRGTVASLVTGPGR